MAYCAISVIPQAREDDVHRAIRAGLEMCQLVEHLAPNIQQTYQAALSLRIGVHTGIVVIDSSDGDGAQTPIALGEVPHIAEEISGLADAYAVVISSATLRLVEGYFICRNLGDYFLEAIARPLVMHQVLQASGAQSRIEAALATRLTPFIGREQEIGLLRASWERAQVGSGQVIVLSGDAGIGKSRLIHTLYEYLTPANPVRIECRCSPYAQHRAFSPIADYLQRLFAIGARGSARG